MAILASALRRVNEQLTRLLPEQQIAQSCRAAGYRFRNRKLTPADSVHLLILQLLAQVALRSLRHLAGLNLSKQAIAQARARLPLEVMLELVRQVCAQARDGCEEPNWLGHRLFIVDGTCCRTDDTPALRHKYKQGKNNYGVSPGCPLVKLLALMDYSTGLLLRVISIPSDQQEKSILWAILRHLRPGDLIMADRGLVSFGHLAVMKAGQLSFCIRLPLSMIVHGRGNPSHRAVRRLGRQDLLVRWARLRRPTWMSFRRFHLLPKSMELRQIALRLHRRGFRTRWVWIVTDLTDAKRYPAERLIELYHRRWQIEVNFRDLKKTLNMTQLRSRSEQGIRKEIAAFAILYNLVRLVMLEASKGQGVPPDRISFADAADFLLWCGAGAEMPKLTVNVARQRKTQPRLLKYLDRRYCPLRVPRAAMALPPYVAKL